MKYDNVVLKIIFLAFFIHHNPMRTKLQHDKIDLALCSIPQVFRIRINKRRSFPDNQKCYVLFNRPDSKSDLIRKLNSARGKFALYYAISSDEISFYSKSVLKIHYTCYENLEQHLKLLTIKQNLPKNFLRNAEILAFCAQDNLAQHINM